MDLRAFTVSELDFQIKLNKDQRNIIQDQMNQLEALYEDLTLLYQSPAYLNHARDLDIVTRWISQLMNARNYVVEKETVNAN